MRFRQNWREKFSGNPQEPTIYQQISEGEAAPGLEHYLPLLFEQTQSFFSYLDKTTTIILFKNLHTIAQQFWQEVEHRYEQLRYDISRPLCKPKETFLSFDQLRSEIKKFYANKTRTCSSLRKNGEF